MRRSDPFFQTRKPHTNNYLESLHRTYQAPTYSRGHELFERALEFRRQEKARYRDLEERATDTQRKYDALCAETDRIHAIWDQFSRQRDDEEQRARPRNPRHAVRVASPPEAEAPGSASMPEQMVRRDGHVGGQVAEDAADGPERGGGDVDTEAVADADVGVQPDRE